MRRIRRDDASSTETAPLIDGDVIAHSKQCLSYCLLLSFEGRLKNLLCHFHLIFHWDGSTIELHCAGFVWWVLGVNSNTAYQSPWGTEPADCFQRFVKKKHIQHLPKQTHCLHFNAPPVCHNQHVDCHVYGDVHDRNPFSSRFTPDMGNATLLMATRPHPEKPSRAEWEMGWRSCWISSRMSICPSGERQVSLKTICRM